MYNIGKELKKAMKFILEFDDENDRLDFHGTSVSILISTMIIDKIMKDYNLSAKQFGKLFGKSKKYITSLLVGDSLIDMKFLAEILLMFNCTFDISLNYKNAVLNEEGKIIHSNELLCVGDIIKSELKAKKISIKDFAILLDISEKSLRKILNNKKDIELKLIYKISDLLDIDSSFLINVQNSYKIDKIRLGDDI